MIYIICPPQGIYIELYINWLKVHLKRKSLKDKWLSFIKEGIFKMNRSHIIFKIRNRHSDEFFLACLQARREDFLQRYCQPQVKHFSTFENVNKSENILNQIWQSAKEKVLCFYRTRVRSLALLVTNSLTDSLPFSKLDWCDPGAWRCQLKTCWGCYCCWCWWWESCWQQFVADLEAEVWS